MHFGPRASAPQNGVGQKSKIFDFAQNDFEDVSDNFPGNSRESFFLWVKLFPKDLENFSKIFASEIDFWVTSQNDRPVDGYQHGSDFSDLIKNVRMAAILVAKNAYIGPKLKYYAI